MDKFAKIEELLAKKKAQAAEGKARKDKVMAKYKDKEKGKPLSTTDRIARIEEILDIE